MDITFVTNDKEYEESQAAIRAGMRLSKTPKGKRIWILPPCRSVNDSFVVVERAAGDVFVESFKTIDGAMLYAMGCEPGDPATASGMADWDSPGALKTETDAMGAKHAEKPV